MKAKDIKPDYFYCLKRNESCEKDLFGSYACETCSAHGYCECKRRKNTSFCNKCIHNEVKNDV